MTPRIQFPGACYKRFRAISCPHNHSPGIHESSLVRCKLRHVANRDTRRQRPAALRYLVCDPLVSVVQNQPTSLLDSGKSDCPLGLYFLRRGLVSVFLAPRLQLLFATLLQYELKYDFRLSMTFD